MIWQQIWEGVQVFFAAVGVMAVLMIVSFWLTIWTEERKAKKLERQRREANWDYQEKRIDGLNRELGAYRMKIGILNQQAGEHMTRLEDLEQFADETQKLLDMMADKLLTVESEQASERRTGMEDGAQLYDLAGRVEKLEREQRATDTWQQITDRQLDRIESSIEDLENEKEEAA